MTEDRVPSTRRNRSKGFALGCAACSQVARAPIHTRKTSMRYHPFVPRCPSCLAPAQERWFVANSGLAIGPEEVFTPDNSHQCTNLFHGAAAPSQEVTPTKEVMPTASDKLHMRDMPEFSGRSDVTGAAHPTNTQELLARAQE